MVCDTSTAEPQSHLAQNRTRKIHSKQTDFIYLFYCREHIVLFQVKRNRINAPDKVNR